MDISLLIFGTLSILFFRSNILKLHLIAFVYPIWVMYLTKIGVSMPGIISAIGLDYYAKYVGTAFWWALIGYWVFLMVLWGVRKRIASFRIVKVEERTRLFFVLCLFASAAIFLPKVFFLSSARFNLIPFFAWGALYNVLSVFLILSHSSFRKTSSVLHIFLLVFIMARGERADQIMTMLSLLLFSGEFIRKEIRLNVKLVVAGGLFFLLVSFIGMVRIIGLNNFFDNFTYYLGLTFYAQQTAADVTHVYMSSVLHYFEEPFNFHVLLNLPMSIFPGLPGGGSNVDNNYVIALMDVVPSYGGGLFYAESAMNFGLIGVLVYSAFLAFLIRYSITCNSSPKAVVTFVLFTLLFRVHWYGLLYIIKPIYIAIFLVLLLKLVTKILKTKQHESSHST